MNHQTAVTGDSPAYSKAMLSAPCEVDANGEEAKRRDAAEARGESVVESARDTGAARLESWDKFQAIAFGTE